MEKNRVIWVIFSISLLLVVVLAGGLYFLRPQEADRTAAAAQDRPSVQGFDTFEFVKGDPEPPGLDETRPEEMVIIVGEPEQSEKPEIKPEINVRPEAVPQQAVPQQAAPKQVVRPRVEQATPVVKSAPVRPKQMQPKQMRVTEYWIQAGSYRSRSRAENLSRSLSEQGLVAKISTREISGDTYYRVRIGPYVRQAEAEKFLSWVRGLKGFEGSYISQVSATHSIN